MNRTNTLDEKVGEFCSLHATSPSTDLTLRHKFHWKVIGNWTVVRRLSSQGYVIRFNQFTKTCTELSIQVKLPERDMAC